MRVGGGAQRECALRGGGRRECQLLECGGAPPIAPTQPAVSQPDDNTSSAAPARRPRTRAWERMAAGMRRLAACTTCLAVACCISLIGEHVGGTGVASAPCGRCQRVELARRSWSAAATTRASECPPLPIGAAEAWRLLHPDAAAAARRPPACQPPSRIAAQCFSPDAPHPAGGFLPAAAAAALPKGVRVELAFKLDGGRAKANARPGLQNAARQCVAQSAGVQVADVAWQGAADGPAGQACAVRNGSWVLATLRVAASDDAAAGVAAAVRSALQSGAAAAAVRRGMLECLMPARVRCAVWCAGPLCPTCRTCRAMQWDSAVSSLAGTMADACLAPGLSTATVLPGACACQHLAGACAACVACQATYP